MKSLFTNLFLTLGVAAVSLPATAQTTAGFPAEAPAAGFAKAPERAPLNTDRSKGVNIFGGTQYDQSIYCNFINLWSEMPDKIERMEPLYIVGDKGEENLPSMYTINAGAWSGDAYYAWRINRYSFGITLPNSWIKVNPETGKWEELKKYYDTPDQDNWYYQYDMAWNPVNDQLYSLAQNTDGTTTSVIGVLDKTTGKWTRTAKIFSEYYFCVAFDYDGKLYAIRWDYDANDPEGKITGTKLDVYDEDFELETSMPLLVDGCPFKIYYQNGLTFDYSTGELWWSADNNEGKQYIVNVDPGTGKTVNKGMVGYNEIMVGLHIPYVTADARTAPARVSDLAYSIAFDGANKVKLTWTNPSKQWNRMSLKKLSEVRIYRDSYEGEPVVVLPADDSKIGQAMEWTDENASQGLHTYYVVACSEAGVKGIEDHIDVFVGRDKPGTVSDLVASTTDGKQVHLSWTAPAKGDSDGWFDSSSVEYIITRMPDNKTFEKISATSFDDTDIPEAQAYSYIVKAVNVDGEGAGVQSNAVLAGRSVLVPFHTDFATQVDADRFTAIDDNGDGVTWQYDVNLHTLGKTMCLRLSNHNNDDILVSPPLSLEAGKTYKVVYTMNHGAYGNDTQVLLNHFKFTGGTAATHNGQTDMLGELVDYEITGTGNVDSQFRLVNYFTAEETGDYYVGLEALTTPSIDMWYYVDEFEISEAPDDDLAAEKLDTYLYVSTTADNNFSVDVYNNGKNRQSDYKVQVIAESPIGNKTVVAETADVPALESHTSAVVKLQGHGGSLGTMKYYGKVVLANDGNEANDCTPEVVVMAEEADAFNHTVKTGTEYLNTSIPFSHMYNYTASQTIYTPEMTKLTPESGDNLEITRIAWEYDADVNVESTDMKVYLSTTDKAGFADGETDFITVSEEPVFNSQVAIEKGTNYLVADLDEAYPFDQTKNLLITVGKKEMAHSDFIARFHVTDNDWNMPLFHSMFATPSAEYDASAPMTGACWPIAPVVHLAVKGLNTNSISEIVLTGEGSLYYSVADGHIYFNNVDVKNVRVYNVNGAQVSNVRVAEGATSAALNLPAGIYVISAQTAAGKPYTLKVNVAK